MTYYANSQPGDEYPIGGGSYNEEEIGYEVCNFLDLDGWLHGYVKSPSDYHVLNLERIDPTADDDDTLNNVLVVFVAKNPKGGQMVVGWYRNATVYRDYQEENDDRRSFDGEYFGYYFEAPTADAVLLPLSARTIRVPHIKHGMVRSNLFYPYDDSGKQRNLEWLEQIVDLVEQYDGENLLLTEATSPEEAAVKGAETAHAGRQGQGFLYSAKVRRAVELRAMAVAEKHFTKDGWHVADHSANKPYDLLATKGNQKLFIEVKGSQGNGSFVFLTPNEVKWARKHHPQTILAVVTGIVVEETEDNIEGKGGKLHLIKPWQPNDDKLEPLGFKFYTDLA
jgi:hypothetical protein